MFKRKSVKKIVSVLLAAVMMLAMTGTLTFAAGADVVGHFYEELSALKAVANNEQNSALAEIESDYAELAALDYTQAPWSNILDGTAGVSALMTDEIKENEGLDRYIRLMHLATQEITINWEGEPVSATEAMLTSFTDMLDEIYADYDVSGDSAQDASVKFPELVTKLGQADALLTNIKNKLAVQGGELEFSVGEASPAQVEATIKAELTRLVKDFNSVLFSNNDSFDVAFEQLLSTDNKKIVAAIFGSDFANALATDSVNNQIVAFFRNENTIAKVIEKQVVLFNGEREEAVTAAYDLAAELINTLLNQSGMEGVKAGFEFAGWTVDDFVAANKYIADMADPDGKARIINLNLFIGRFMGVYKEDVACDTIEFNCEDAEDLEFDIAMAVGSYKASIINVINSFVYDEYGEKSETIISDDSMGTLKFVVESLDEGDFTLRVYRSGGTNSVYGFLGEFDVKVECDTIPVTKITLNVGNTLSMKAGKTKQLTATVIPENATNKNIIWESSDEEVAVVSDDGLVTAIAKGKVVITAKTEDGSVKASVTITVSSNVSYVGGGTGSTPVKPNADAKITFADMKYHWAKSDIEEMANAGIISGYKNPDGTYSFAPDKEVTRAEFATMVARALGLEENNNIIFTDTQNHWAKGYISAMAERGFMIGYDDDTFKPDLLIPREQIIVVAVRSACMAGDVVNNGEVVTDNQALIDKIYAENPELKVSDSEITATDFNETSEWAKEYVKIALVTNMLNGYANGSVRPTSNATRAEAAVIIKRVLLG